MLIQAKPLTAFIAGLLRSVGSPPHISHSVAITLISADLAGHFSHGINTLPTYLEDVRRKHIDPNAEPEVVKDQFFFLHIDGKNGYGHYAAHWAVERVIERAKSIGFCFAGLTVNHLGRLGYYVEKMVEASCIGIVVNGYGNNTEEALVAPYGGREHMLGTNPIAIGIPSGDNAPLILDMATSAVSYFQLEHAIKTGALLPQGCILDLQGNPSRNPKDFYNGGSITLFGGYKGFGLSLVACLLGGLSGEYDKIKHSIGGTVIIAFDLSSICNAQEYQLSVRNFLQCVRQSAPRCVDSPVRIPGDQARLCRERQLRDGLHVPEQIWQVLTQYAKELNVPVPGSDSNEQYGTLIHTLQKQPHS